LIAEYPVARDQEEASWFMNGAEELPMISLRSWFSISMVTI
jgi:hypothetical protein